MVRAHYIGEYEGRFNVIHEFLVYKEVIQSPSNVSVPGTGSVTPPGVVISILVEFPEGVHVTMADESVKSFPFNG